MTKWYRGEPGNMRGVDPLPPVQERVLESPAPCRATNGIHEIVELRWDSGPTCLAFYMGAHHGGGEESCAHLLDLRSGDRFDITVSDQVEARKVRVKDLPPEVLAVWPKTENGDPHPTGYGPQGETIFAHDLEEIIKDAEIPPAMQKGLFD